MAASFRLGNFRSFEPVDQLMSAMEVERIVATRAQPIDRGSVKSPRCVRGLPVAPLNFTARISDYSIRLVVMGTWRKVMIEHRSYRCLSSGRDSEPSLNSSALV
jgi:hypothetical protein